MIRQADPSDISTVAALALQLWPDNEPEELKAEFGEFLKTPGAAVFLAFEKDVPIGFAQCQLRHDYVEGTSDSPVGYLEGIYVSVAHRRLGFARLLLAACEVWAKKQGCREFASDCELTNGESLRFHLNVGFAEANRIICFMKTI